MWGRATASVFGGLAAAILWGGLVAVAIGSPRGEALPIGGVVAVTVWGVLMSVGFMFRDGMRAWGGMAALCAAAIVGLALLA